MATACDRQMNRWMEGHLVTAQSAICIALRGKNREMRT